MAATAAAAPSDAEPLLAAGDPHVVLNKAGVIVRAGVSKSSALVGEVGLDGMVAVDAYAKDERGTVRLRLASPRGWVSAKLLRPLSVVEAVGRSGASLVVVYAVNAKVGAKWYYGWLRDVLLADVDAVFVPVGDDFFGEAGRRRAAWLPANGDDRVAARARLLAGAARCLVVWNDFEHDRSVVERFVDAAPCPLALFHVGDERTSDALAAWEPSWPGQEKSDSKFASTGAFRARASWPEAIRADFEALEREDPAAAKAADLRRLYGKCGCVLRCYRDEAYGDLGNVLAVPLGYKTGFRKPPGGAARTNAWAFAGQGTKSSRRAMLGEQVQVVGVEACAVYQSMGRVSAVIARVDNRPRAGTTTPGPPTASRRAPKSSSDVGASGPHASRSSPVVAGSPSASSSAAASRTCTGWKTWSPAPATKKTGTRRSTHAALFIRIDSSGVSPKMPQGRAIA
ncbi:hypothetical protein JL720_15513 [Aureococcus anophagefferens]|nr:hypothetical protein JL720_15513 [Aureococcus anophagefferens]